MNATIDKVMNKEGKGIQMLVTLENSEISGIIDHFNISDKGISSKVSKILKGDYLAIFFEIA